MTEGFSAESRLIHAGTERMAEQPATPPLAPASIYVSRGSPRPGRGYGRDGNPGWEALEQALGGLEDAEAVAFASGQAASMALMLALAPGRGRIVLPDDGYYGGRVLADRLRPHGAVPVPVDLQDLGRARWSAETAPAGLIRLSVGVEPAADLITDIDQALGVLLCDVLSAYTKSTTTRPGSIPRPRWRS